MRIGLFSAYAFRPHVEHLAWLGRLAEASGHRVFAISCDGSVSSCYSRELLGRGRWHCMACSLGGLRGFGTGAVRSLRRSKAIDPCSRDFTGEVITSVRSMLRLEDPSEVETEEASALGARLAAAAAHMYGRLRREIEDANLDALLIFNGRMDLTRAAVRAAEDCGIAYASVERGAFDTGLRIFPYADCQALRHEHELQVAYASAPLARRQALAAAALASRRFLNRPVSEWRTYNQSRRHAEWPGQGSGPRVLVGPSSRYEMSGEPEREMAGDPRDLIDEVVSQLGAAPGNVVVRGHPVWGERIGGRAADSSLRYYLPWAERRGYRFIRPEDPIDTLGLMLDSDVVVGTGGTIGFEASVLGRPTISLAPCFYSKGGAAIAAPSPSLASELQSTAQSPRRVARLGLRSLFTHLHRFTQYGDFARPLPQARGGEWLYRDGATFEAVEKSLETGSVAAWDAETAAGEGDEDSLLDMLLARDFESILREASARSDVAGEWHPLSRSWWAVPITVMRRSIPKGDRLG